MKKSPPFLVAFLLGLQLALTGHASTLSNESLEAIDHLLTHATPGEDIFYIDDMGFKVSALKARREALLKKAGGPAPNLGADANATKWPGGRVPYVFTADVTPTQRSQFVAACAEWQAVANVTFVPRAAPDANYLTVSNSDGNSSLVGMTGGSQPVGLYNWEERFVICHELAHALGFDHEQSRSDRDTYVIIQTNNISPDDFAQFEKVSSINLTPYDFDSIMHYGRRDFAINPSLDTITPRPGYEDYGQYIGNRTHLSGLDKQGMAAFYGNPVMNAVRTPKDFNNDKTSDIVWQNTHTGARDVWTLRNAALYQVAHFADIPTEWQIAAVGDFNADNYDDLLWQNSRTGQRDIWLMQGVGLKSVLTLGTIPVAWQAAAAGDFDGDRKTDILWQNTQTGQRDIWLMNGTALRQVVNLATIGLEWRIAAAGDINGDGTSDIVWQNNQTGQRDVWTMQAARPASIYRLATIPVEWQIVGVGDFNADARTDVVWQNTRTGDRDIWLLGANGSVQATRFATIPVEWSIADH